MPIEVMVIDDDGSRSIMGFAGWAEFSKSVAEHGGCLLLPDENGHLEMSILGGVDR